MAAGGTLELVPEIVEEKTDCSLDKFPLSPAVKGFELNHYL